MILIIDNYDSFTYNLYQYVGQITEDVLVCRNDKITIDDVKTMAPSHIIISPGPKFPKDAGISINLIKEFGGVIPILGVCLGHQAIAEAYGGMVVHAKELMHGKPSIIKINNTYALFNGLQENIKVGRYHSLIVDKSTIPDTLEIIAMTDKGEIMGIKHKKYLVFGIQFHPESILTPNGIKIIKNFIDIEAES